MRWVLVVLGILALGCFAASTVANIVMYGTDALAQILVVGSGALFVMIALYVLVRGRK